ncbi:DUF1345 domain-containing protein [Hymenobacter jeollabukensis]|uniref:DUF1345 domain-containing protein n=1 Tax=Hymenobacter jeollabukensis TaxID=2025313 RepID=A0A5R8WSS1_9BACT|nr:DUF1345 domain-containing protein [Hymenobacter jeollabukensis]TLM94244.1 DUF1345 domain-containing protein [Hymenobacter jeollabukensis]
MNTAFHLAQAVSGVARPALLTTRGRLLRLLLALVGGVVAYALAPADFDLLTRLMLAWDGYVFSGLAMAWQLMAGADIGFIRRSARALNPHRSWAVMYMLLILGSVASLSAVLLLLHGLDAFPYEERLEHVLVSVGSVVGSWFLLHTLFTLRYAHIYFCPDPDRPGHETGGFRFAGAAPCSYWDFAYLAFVVGVTAQTSDVLITTKTMRRLVMLHGLLAFAYNTTVLALGINILSDML